MRCPSCGHENRDGAKFCEECAAPTGPAAGRGARAYTPTHLAEKVLRLDPVRRRRHMALFGAPIAHEDHARQACYAALHLTEELRRYSRQLWREIKMPVALLPKCASPG